MKYLLDFVKRHNIFIKSLLFVLLIFVLYKSIDFNKILRYIALADRLYLYLGLLLFFIGNIFGTFSWYFIMRSSIKQITLWDVFSSYWAGLFFNNVLPTNVGGDVVKGYDLIAKYKRGFNITSSILLDRVIGLSILLLFGVFSFSFFFLPFFYFISVSIGAVVAIVLLILLNNKITKISYRILTFIFKGKVRRFLKVLTYSQSVLVKNRGYLFTVLFFMFMSQLLKVLTSVMIVFALNDGLNWNIPPGYAFFICPVLGLLSLVSIAPGGIGIREYLVAYIFSGLEMEDAKNTVVVISLVGHVIMVLSNLPGGIFFFFKKKRVNS